MLSKIKFSRLESCLPKFYVHGICGSGSREDCRFGTEGKIINFLETFRFKQFIPKNLNLKPYISFFLILSVH